jgi:aminopeptidase
MCFRYLHTDPRAWHTCVSTHSDKSHRSPGLRDRTDWRRGLNAVTSRPPPRPSAPIGRLASSVPPRPSSRPPSRPSIPSFPLLNDFEIVVAARRVLEEALSVVRGDIVVVIVDRARADLGAILADVTHMIGARAKRVVLEELGPRPLKGMPYEIATALDEAQASILLISVEENEIAFRREMLAIVGARKLRHAHMVGVSRRSMIAGLSVDPARIFSTTRAVRMRLRADSIFHLRTSAGSDLTVRLDPACRWTEHVGVIRPGRWENLPSGALVTVPADVRGVFVADGSIGGDFGTAAGLLSCKPVRVEIDSGLCRVVKCVDRSLQRSVEQFLRRDPSGDRVGTVILGTNVGLRDPLGDALADQNLPGLHISFGAAFPDETGSHWTARTQLPMTAAAADVDLDGVALVRAGRYLVS